MLEYIDDLEIVLRTEFRLADSLEVRYRQLSARRRTRHVELENVLGQNESLRRNRGLSLVRRVARGQKLLVHLPTRQTGSKAGFGPPFSRHGVCIFCRRNGHAHDRSI